MTEQTDNTMQPPETLAKSASIPVVYQSSLNVIGLVNSFALAKQKAIYPLFEAFSNSLHAIEDAVKLGLLPQGEGRITITIHRDKAQTDPLDEAYPVDSMIIEDNGIGFTEENFNSYHDAYSDYKASRGGKGLGHYTKLKVFQEVEVDSVYRDGDNGLHRRFKFLKARPEIVDHSIVNAKKGDKPGTKIFLQNIRPEYYKHIPVKLATIADRIIEHFLLLFVGGLAVSVNLREADDSESVDVGKHYEDAYETKGREEQFPVGNHTFRLQHFRKKKADHGKHMLSFSAYGREVSSVALEKRLPVLKSKLRSDEGSFYYHGYVSSDFFDAKVNKERTAFDITDSIEDEEINPDMLERLEPTLEDITQESVTAVKAHLSDFIQGIEEENIRSTEDYIDRSAPYYRFLKEFAPEQIAAIPSNADDHEKDLSLYKIKQDLDRKAKEGTSKLLREAVADPKYMREHREEVEERLHEINAIKQSELARYVIQRHRILEILQQILELGEDGKPHLEETFHELIFPMKKTSDEISYEQHNLWLIDERLSFHNYLASDITMRSNEALDAEDTKEPDVVIFNKPISLAEGKKGPYKQISILEFKRPQKETHKDEYNPLNQVNEYMDRITQGEVMRHGRKLDIGDPDTVRFFCYIVCELSPQIIRTAQDLLLTQLPEKEGFIGYNQYRRAFYEVIPFDRLVADAEKRNQAWFEKLGI